MGIRNSPLGAPYLSSLLHRCVDDWLGCSSLSSHCSRSLVLGEEGASHRCSRNEGSSVRLEYHPSRGIEESWLFSLATMPPVMAYQTKQGSIVFRLMCSLVQDVVT